MPSIQSFSLPLKVSDNRRFLVDQKGAPFFIHGDTAWSIITGISDQEAEQYLANRAAKGVNAIIVNLIEHKFSGPLTRAGEHPFTDPEDVSKVNERYFDYASSFLEKASSYGILVFLAPMYLGYRNPMDTEGWYHEARLSGMNKCYQYGRYLGKRFAHLNNILWMIGGDRNPDGVQDETNSMLMGIKAEDPHSLFTAHPHPEETTPDRYNWSGWLDLSTTYTYAIVHSNLLRDYNRRPVMPFVLIESTYEGEHNSPPDQIRRQAYWAPLCGACGQFLGNNPIWLFNPGWQQAMEWEGSRSMVHLKTFFTSRPWHALIPDQKHEIVTGGLGEFRGLTYLAAARTADGNTLMAYMPTAREMTIDLSKMSGSRVTAWWFDPRTGEGYSAGEHATTSEVQFAPPGAGDWAFVADNSNNSYAAPGR